MTPLATEGVRNADSMQKTRCQTPLSPSEINNLIEALHQGVTPATGCTEPIALAYAAARAKRALGSDAKQLDSLHIDARVSPNIMKNGMAVMVPGTGRPGLEIAAAVGALAGNPDAGLAVLADVSEDAAEKARHLVDSGAVELTVADVDDDLYAETVLHLDGHHARACIAGDHTNVFLVSRDDEVLESKERPAAGHVPPTAALLQGLSLAKIYDFATTVDIERIEFITEAERLNSALVDAGRDGSYGIGEGAAILGSIDRGMASDDLCTRMTAYTAAASDARMGGAPFAGNDQQWIRQPRHRRHRPSHCRGGLRRCRPRTARARPGPLSRRRALRPAGLPVLSAFCAATTAAMGAAAGICLVLDGSYSAVERAVASMTGDVVGMVCDGAGCSCALKVSASANAAGRAALLSLAGRRVPGTNGLVHDDVDAAIRGIGRLGTEGMKQTDPEILSLMMAKQTV
ncbi:putative inner membrane protein [Cutibacterium acnes 266]|nr:putative inner membrane protein [Cutibacterium acnes 266]